jgi:hypothetical protein
MADVVEYIVRHKHKKSGDVLKSTANRKMMGGFRKVWARRKHR